MPALLRLMNKKLALPSVYSSPQPTEATSAPNKKKRGLSKLKQLRRKVARSDVKDIVVVTDQDDDDEQKVVAELAYTEDDLTLTATLSTLSTVTDNSTISASSTLSSVGSTLSASNLTPSTTIDFIRSAGDSSTPFTTPTPTSIPAAPTPTPTLKQRLHTIPHSLRTLKHRIIFSSAYNRARIFCAPGRRIRIRITDFLSLSIKTTLKFVFETLPWNIYFYTGKVVFGLGIILAIVAFIVGVKLGKI